MTDDETVCPGCGWWLLPDEVSEHLCSATHDEALAAAATLIGAVIETLLEDEEDARITPENCGHTTVGALGIEWVCIRKPHLNVYRRRRRSVRTGEPYETHQDQSPPRPGESTQGERHYMVRRWPNRPVHP